MISPKNSAEPGKKWLEQTVTVKNASDHAIYVYGHSLASVFISVSTKDPVTQQWVSLGLGYCGIPSCYALAPAQSFPATIALPSELSDREYRIEVETYSGPEDAKPVTVVSPALRMKRPEGG
ncbi:MAG: hypothetical protein ACLQLG_01510 [Thermoguttaceae bacterium]